MSTLLATRSAALPPAPSPYAGEGCVQITRQPSCVNLTLYQGDDFVMSVGVTDADTGQPVDLAGTTPLAQIRAKSGGPLLGEFDCSISAPNTVVAVLAGDTSQELPAKSVWDLQIQRGTPAQTTTLIVGALTVTPDITRPGQP